MRRYTKQLIAVLLAGLLPVTIAACGGDDTAGGGDDGNGNGNGNGDETAQYELTVEDQTVDDASAVTVDSVTTDGDDLWVVIHADEDGSPGEVRGWTFVEGADDSTEGIEVDLDPEAEDGETLWAMLHVDDPGDEEFTFGDEEDADPPAMVDDEIVQDDFEVTVEDDDGGNGGGDTPAITVEDQTFAEGEADVVSIAEATLDEPGFVVIHQDDGGEFGDIIGSSDVLEAGTSENVEVQLDRQAEDGETLWAMLHHDGNGDEEFNGSDDLAVKVDDEIVVKSFEVTVEEEQTGDAPDIVVEDQVLPADAPDMVSIPEVVLEENGFVVIHADDGGSPGDVIGSSDLLEGADSPHSGVSVLLDRAAEDGETLWGMLHSDGNDDGEFNSGNDDPPVEDDAGEVVTESFQITLPSVDAGNVSLDGDNGDLSTIVTIDNVVSNGDGWLVVHENGCGDFGGVLGHAAVSHGENTDVEVELEAPAAEGGSNADLCAMLHTDDGNGEYDFNGSGSSGDGPVQDDEGEIVMDTFNASVTEGTAAIRVTLGANGTSSYTVDGVEPSLFEDDVDDDNGDIQEFSFRAGWRYEFDNPVFSSHPFEFMNENNDDNGVLLSQSVEGELESEGSIDWNEVSDETFRFTVSDDFQNDTLTPGDPLGSNAVEHYRCRSHPGSMTGTVVYQ